MDNKDSDSMTTVQIKPEYAASEVYSTASEPPPAYRRQSSSVQIAKIIAVTIIASSFIIGCFVLASTYLHAKASCDQMTTLDSVLEKELLLETLQQEIPKAEALFQTRDNELKPVENEIDKEEKKEDIPDTKSADETSLPESDSSSTDSSSDSSFSDESEELNRIHIKLPLEFDLSNLANALLENNQKSRMNCVVERRRAEELVDAPSKIMQLPFGLNLTTDEKKQRVTGERISIFCDNGAETSSRDEEREEDNDIRPIIIPLNRFPIPFGPIPQQIPLTHMPQQQIPPQQMSQHQMPELFQQRQMPLHVPSQFQIPPREIVTEMRQMPFMSFNQRQEQQQMPQQQQRTFRFPPQFMLRQMSPASAHMMLQSLNRPSLSQQTHNMIELPLTEEIHQQDLPPVPDQIMQAPRPEQPEFRIHLQRIPVPIRGEMSEPVEVREIPITNLRQLIQQHQQEQQEQRERELQLQREQQQQQQQQQPQLHVQRIPLSIALQRVGITPDDLKNIQRMAEERIQQEIHQLRLDDNSNNNNNDENNNNADDNESSTSVSDGEDNEDRSAEDDVNKQNNDNNMSDNAENTHESQTIMMDSDEFPRQILQMARGGYGRSLAAPVRIPVNMMQQELQEERSDSERPHFVQPRSVRSVDNVLTKGNDHKRIKRCACDCNC